MLIETITFEIHDFKKNSSETYTVPTNQINYERILGIKNSRNIQIGQTFGIDLPAVLKQMRKPVELIDFSTELENELDEVDEMVGLV